MKLERHGHGGDIWTAAELYGLDKNGFLDFSSNMNPLGPPESAERILREEWRRELARYPDPDCRELRSAIARLYRVPEEAVLAGNGAAELIDLAVRTLAPRTVGLLRPCFSEYAEAAEKAGASTVDLPLREENGFLPDPEDPGVIRGEAASDILFFGHPNNPTGRLLPQAFIRRMLQTGKPLILDEAFIDFSGDEERFSLIREAPLTDKLLIVRSLTKFYTIPGLRLGFIVAHPDLIRRMKRLQVQWSVNALAQRIGIGMLGDRDFEDRTRAWLGTERPWLKERMEQLGLRVTDSDANYLLFRIPDEYGFTVHDLQGAMGRRGILIRDASTFGHLHSQYGRTAVKLREDNVRLVQGLQESIRELESGLSD